jgi:tRNA A-37 threonylcarbamoyl transferase component Bud32
MMNADQILLITEAQQLYHVEKKADFPFAIELLPGEYLVCHDLYRRLPDKRLTVLATWREKKVVAKLFYDPKRGTKHFLRELKGCLAMQATGVPSARCIHGGAAMTKGLAVVVLDYIEDAEPLSLVWATLQEPEKQTTLKKIVKILVTLHEAGIRHRDLHFGNFLVQGKNLFIIDGDSVIVDQDKQPMFLLVGIKNLALFCVELPATDKYLAEYLLCYYLTLRKFHIKKPKVDKYFCFCCQKLLRKKQEKAAKKAFRECTALRMQKAKHERVIISREIDSPAFTQMLETIDHIVDHADCLKAGNTCTLVRHNYEGQTYVIKRYNIKNKWHQFSRCWRPTRASNAWRNAYVLQQLTIPTPDAVALKESRFGWLRGKAYFVYCYVDGILLNDFFTNNTIFDTEIAERVVTLFRCLFDANMTHGDLKASNIVLSKEKPVLLDLDSLTCHKSQYRFQSRWRKDMQRFLKNWDELPHIQAIFYHLLEEKGLLT